MFNDIKGLSHGPEGTGVAVLVRVGAGVMVGVEVGGMGVLVGVLGGNGVGSGVVRPGVPQEAARRQRMLIASIWKGRFIYHIPYTTAKHSLINILFSVREQLYC
jgi:hypothetical protein